jgi:2-methylcitrate dehydratase PrpD
MSSGIGIAACLSSGLRAAHGTMTMHLVPAQAASLGVQAALLAQSGFTGPEDILEGRHGYLSIFAIAPHTPSLSMGLGTRFELLANTFKAYPCGIVIHPVIDACLSLRSTDATIAERIEILELFISEATARLADRPNPRNEFEAQVSVQHWAAAALLQGTAEIAQGRQSVIDNVKVRDLRVRCRLTVVPEMAVDAAAVRLVLRDGGEIDCRTAHCKGSLANPLSGDALEEKFMNQSVPVLGVDAARTLLERCRSIPMIDDIGLVWSHL